MTTFARVSLGKQGKFADLALREGWIGTGWLGVVDLSTELPNSWRDFNRKFIPVVMETDRIISKVGAGLACGMTWTISRGLEIGDIVLSGTADKDFLQIGRVAGQYFYAQGQDLPHRRKVDWFPNKVSKSELSEGLRASFSAGTVQIWRDYDDELIALANKAQGMEITISEEDVESPYAFVMEKYLESFLVSNWSLTPLGKEYDIYQEDGVLVGQQYMSDTGPMDILAISKDKKTLLVIELKRGKASDRVVGQIQRYMGFVHEELLESGQVVKGLIIGQDEDRSIRRALAVAPNIDFMRYEIDFRLLRP